MGDENPIHTLGDYSKPSHEGYKNTIELLVGNNMFFPLGRTVKLRNDILIFQQHQGGSLSEAWTHFKDLLLKVPHHGLDLWLQVQIFYDHVGCTTQMAIDYAACGRLGKIKAIRVKAFLECRSNMMRQLPSEPSRQVAFEDLVMNFILDQEELVKQLKEYIGVIRSDFMKLSLKVVEKLKDDIRAEETRVKNVEKITRYPKNEDLKPSSNLKFSEALSKSTSFHAPDFILPKSLYVKKVFKKNEEEISTVAGDGVRIYPDGITPPAT
ncbi:hypothetical protein Tco_0788176 [Tanacetum coccineum]